jgi:Asp-tRNA(Asn)/Glu-tRNA(Gln) amidotransferase A subunit family amidase
MTMKLMPLLDARRLAVVAGALIAALVMEVAVAPRAVAAAAATPAPGLPLEEITIDDIQAAILAKRVTTVQVVEGYLRRIKAYNGTCVNEPEGILGPITTKPHAGQINALSTLNLRPAARKAWGFDDRKARSMTDRVDASAAMPDALEVAAEQDRQFAATGRLVGPLQGVVMAVKDQYDTFDLRTTAGADVDYANDRPPADSTFVTKLREAGAIILAKANLGEYASAVPRSSFGGTFCNPYDTERSPRGSSSGSGSAVGANLVTCAIAEESGSSIRGPASAASSVGIAATEELVSRKGMVQIGINTRVGPICRTVVDAAKILDVIAGYDPKDELTVFSIGRTPKQPYATFAAPGSLRGLRIGVVREYMRKSLLTKADEETIDIVSRGAEDLMKLGATVVDPGPEGELFTDCLRRLGPQSENRLFTKKYPDLFPVDATGKPTSDHSRALLALKLDPSKVPADFTLRELGASAQDGQNKYFMDLYLAERGDASVKTNADLISKARFHQDPTFPDRKRGRENAEKVTEYNMAERLLRRFSVQQLVLQCMAEQKLDALVYPTASLPPRKLGSPGGPSVNGRRGNDGVWSFIGAQGFPVVTVPAGYTTEVYDLVRDPTAPKTPDAAFGTDGGGERLEGDDRTRLVGPLKAVLPVGMDIAGRPFDEPLLLRIAAAYEAATHHRHAPPEFGPLPVKRK